MRFMLALALVACGKDSKPGAPPPPPTTSSNAPAKLGLVFGEATVYELVDRRWNKREPPSREFTMDAGGKIQMFHDKTGEPRATLLVKPDGSVLYDGTTPMATIGEREIAPAGENRISPLAVDGNTITVSIEDEKVKVVLADDGNITVLGRPDGNKWRIDAKDAAVRRTAFLVLGLQMQTALD